MFLIKYWDILKKAGITHLLAVSGSNVALVISISKIIFLKLVGNKYSKIFSIFFIIFFFIFWLLNK